jgi:hypothetical protein
VGSSELGGGGGKKASSARNSTGGGLKQSGTKVVLTKVLAEIRTASKRARDGDNDHGRLFNNEVQ